MTDHDRCTHPWIGPQTRHRLGLKYQTKTIQSLDEVLELMLGDTMRDLETNKRAHLSHRISRGQILEYEDKKEDALEVWLECLPELQLEVSRCETRLRAQAKQSEGISDADSKPLASSESSEKQSNTIASDLRLWRELLHRCFFFLGSIYFQLEKPEQEQRFYADAKAIRSALLTDPECLATQAMEALKKDARAQKFVLIPEIKYPKETGGIFSRSILERLQSLTEILNKQAEHLDEFREQFIQRLSADLADQNDDPSGEEYQNSLDAQSEALSYHTLVRFMVDDRAEMVVGTINHHLKNEISTTIANLDLPDTSEILKDGMKMLQKFRSRDVGSLNQFRGELRIKIRNLEEKMSHSTTSPLEHQIASAALKQLDKQYQQQQEAVIGLTKEAERLVNVYNYRLEYYRQLQAVSDQVQAFTVLKTEKVKTVSDSLDDDLERARGRIKRVEIAESDIHAKERARRVKDALLQNERAILQCRKKVDQAATRTRYLDFLGKIEASDTEPCLICTSSITIGAITICGHLFCRDCFMVSLSSSMLGLKLISDRNGTNLTDGAQSVRPNWRPQMAGR